MNAKQLAKMLNGREYLHETTEAEEAQAKENGLVVVFGASDNLVEFRGAIDDEIGAYQGGTTKLSKNGLPHNKCEDPQCPYFKKERDAMVYEIRALWGLHGYSWAYDTNIPHEAFDIFEEGDKYCRGIVFYLGDLA